MHPFSTLIRSRGSCRAGSTAMKATQRLFFESFDPLSVDVFAETFFEAFDLEILCLRGFRVALAVGVIVAVVVMRRVCHLADIYHREENEN